MEYKGYTAKVEFDEAACVLHGEVDGLRDVVAFESKNADDLERAFHESVDDYLAMCAQRGEQPERPYSGKFMVRIDPMLHRRLSLAAAGMGKSLNSLVSDMLSGIALSAGIATQEVLPSTTADGAPGWVDKE